jgi:GT2 family glycosyltransferase
VINDGSVDDTKYVLDEFVKRDPRIRCYHNSSRQGQQKSKNKGVYFSKNRLIFFAEDDVILDKYCLQTLVETFEKITLTKKHLCVGAIGPRLIEKNNVYHAKIVEISKMTGYIYTNFGLNAEGIIEVPTLHACSLVNKEVFEEVGGFDEELYKGFAYREETDLYYRAERSGFYLFFQSRALAYHLQSPIGGSHSGLSRAKHGYYFIRNHILFLTRFYKARISIMIPAFLLFTFFVLKLPSKKPRW